MFRVEFFVEDEKLSYALRTLTGLTSGLPHVQHEAETVPPVMLWPKKAMRRGNGKLIDQFTAHLRRQQPKEINAAWARKFMLGIGASPRSYSHVLAQAAKKGLLKKKGFSRNVIWQVTLKP